MGKAEFLGEGGTSVLSIIPERDVCLFHKDDNDQSAYPCPSPLIDRGSDDLQDLMALPCQAWFDAEAPESFDCDGLDATATTEQHLRTLARSEVRIESPREILANPKFLNTSVGTQKVEGEFALSEADGLVWSGNSAERIMRLLRSKRGFSELKDQKGEQLCEQESGQARQMDRGEIKVEEERRVRAKRVPVLKEKRVAATSGHGSWTLHPRRAHGPCVDTEDPQCGGNLPSASRKFGDSCGKWCAGRP